MRGRLAVCILFAVLLGFASPARALDMNPGDSCAAFPAGAYRPTGGQENPDGALVVCDGSIWQPILRYSSAGNAVMFSSTGLPAAPVHVWGEAIIGNQGLACGAAQEGALRYTSSTDTWEYCDGTAWTDLTAGGSGLWSDSGSGYIEYDSALGGVRIGDVSGEPAPNIIGVTNLNDLGDVSLTSPASDEVLSYNGSNWVNGALTLSQLPAIALNDLSDAAISSPAADEVLTYDGTDWVNQAVNMDPAGSDRQIQFNSGGSFGADANLVFSSVGRLGIGTASPGAMLEVAGQVKITGGTPGSGKVLTSDSAGLATWQTVSESDPEVGTLTNGKWCTSDGSVVNCTSDITLSDLPAIAITDLSDAYAEYSTKDSMYLGNNAGVSASPGLHNVALGVAALGSLDTTCSGANDCSQITAIGKQALAANTTGRMNTALGYQAGMSTTTGSLNTFVGRRAGQNNTEGESNAFFGGVAGSSNINGSRNTALGRAALEFNSSSSNNTAVGYRALQNATSAENVAVGQAALSGASGMSGNRNTAVGRLAISSNAAGGNNVAMGHGALQENTDGDRNIAIGASAGDLITTGSDNIIIGYNVDPSSATASNELNIGDTIYGDLSTGNVGIGTTTATVPLDVAGVVRAIDDAAGCTATERGAIRFNSAGDALELCDGSAWGGVGGGASAINDLSDGITGGSSVFLGEGSGISDDGSFRRNTGLGKNALNAVTSGQLNTAVGYDALLTATTGHSNVAVGIDSLRSVETGWGNIAIGRLALEKLPGGGSINVAIGMSAMRDHSGTGQGYNVAVGHGAMRYSSSGAQNTAVGANALAGDSAGMTGIRNTAIGRQSMYKHSSGWQNTAVGWQSMLDNTTGGGNTAIGALALANNTSGPGNVTVGYRTLLNNTTGRRNVAIGERAMGNGAATDGDMDHNTVVGWRAGYNIEGGAEGAGANNNVLLGYLAGDVITTGDNNIIIGYDVDPTSATASNELNIGETIYGDLSAGNVGIGTATPQSKLDVNGEVQVGDSGAGCTSSNEGAQRYNGTEKRMEFCDGSAWKEFGGGAVPTAGDILADIQELVFGAQDGWEEVEDVYDYASDGAVTSAETSVAFAAGYEYALVARDVSSNYGSNADIDIEAYFATAATYIFVNRLDLADNSDTGTQFVMVRDPAVAATAFPILEGDPEHETSPDRGWMGMGFLTVDADDTISKIRVIETRGGEIDAGTIKLYRRPL